MEYLLVHQYVVSVGCYAEIEDFPAFTECEWDLLAGSFAWSTRLADDGIV